MPALHELSPKVSKRRALDAVGIPRASFYRHSKPEIVEEEKFSKKIKSSPREALSLEEKKNILEVLCSERFVDRSPREVFATLLDEDIYLCSIRSMYRILRENNCAKERRAVARRTDYVKPELIATAPNQVWTWDITKLKGPKKWNYFYLYVMVDIFSRYIVGWMVATRETAQLAQVFIRETTAKYGINPDTLTIHSDRGSSMTAKTTTQLHVDLGILQSLSRPQVSNDNPFSEATFKTIKYSAGFPNRFENATIARSFCAGFFPWYNDEHKHTGLELFTPHMVHYGLVEEIAKKRQQTLLGAYLKNPSRFSRTPKVCLPNMEVYINPPSKSACASQVGNAENIVEEVQVLRGEPNAKIKSKKIAFGEGRQQPLKSELPAGDSLC